MVRPLVAPDGERRSRLRGGLYSVRCCGAMSRIVWTLRSGLAGRIVVRFGINSSRGLRILSLPATAGDREEGGKLPMRPGDFALGTPESRAAARTTLGRRRDGRA